ncbi:MULTISPECIES: hypothetical protein, partial [Rhizobium]
ATAMALVSTTQVSAADFASEGSSGHSSPASERGSDDDGSYSGNNGWQLVRDTMDDCAIFTRKDGTRQLRCAHILTER